MSCTSIRDALATIVALALFSAFAGNPVLAQSKLDKKSQPNTAVKGGDSKPQAGQIDKWIHSKGLEGILQEHERKPKEQRRKAKGE
jgi:hypothetical protein